MSILGIAMLLFLAVYMFDYSLIAWIVTIVWIALGLVIYRGYAYQREVTHIHKIKSLERIEKQEYSIMVCLSNPKTSRSLIDIAIAIARKYGGEIIFLSVLEVREGQPLMAGLEESARARPMLDEAESIADKHDIPARSIIKVAHRVSYGIIDTAIEEDCNFIVLGRQKNPDFFDRLFSSLIDNVLQKAPSEVAILHGNFVSENIRNIMIPFGANIHTHLAAEIAPAILKHFNARLSIAVVFEPGTPDIDRQHKIEDIKKMLQENNLEAQLKVVVGRDVLNGILSQAANADLVLMGGRSGDFLELMLGKSLTQEITEKIRCPVLWLKEYEERETFWSSLLKPYKKAGE